MTDIAENAITLPVDKERYEVDPEPLFEGLHFLGYDGYDIMAVAEQCGWEAIAGWGKDGYDLGDWPYVVVYSRKVGSMHQVAIYVEGDMTAYQVPSLEVRNAIIDDTAFFYWKHKEQEWVQGYSTVENLPPELRGPYRH